MVKEHIIGQTEVFMKVTGKMVKEKDKVNIHMQKRKKKIV